MGRLRWRRMILLALAVCGLCLPSGAFAFLDPGRGLYGIDAGTDSLYRVDVNTGAATLIGPIGQNMNQGGLAYDTSTHTMYVSEVENAGQFALGTVNLTTGAVTIVGDHVNSANIRGLAYDSVNDVLYGSDIDAGGLATIDRATGVSTFIGSFVNATSIGGLAYCPANDTLYGIDNTNILTINPSTGLATVLGAHGITGMNLLGLDYDENSGKLYASSATIPNLYDIDMGSGAHSPIGASNFELSGLASVPAQGDISVLYVNSLMREDGDFKAGLDGMDIDGLSLVSASQITPLTAYMQNFDVVLVATHYVLDDPAALGNRLADYVDAGGALGLMSASLSLGWTLSGRIVGQDYSPLAPDNYILGPPSTATVLENHAITSGITTLTTTFTTFHRVAQGAGEGLGVYDSGYLVGAYRDDMPIAALNFHPQDGLWTGDYIEMVENMIHWLTHDATRAGGGGGCFISDLDL